MDPHPTTLVRDLDGKRLAFRNDKRPRVQYLYFAFVVARLRLAWRRDYGSPSKALAKQFGKGFWATKGPYLPRSFLLALAVEIGHDVSIVKGSPIMPGDDDSPNGTVVIAIAKFLQFKYYTKNDEEDIDYWRWYRGKDEG
ncbi:hypothetical protein F5Y04DRAFT_246520 [Hypomontagnella monticulosa]|nr:hypothetical protein F5Y04DRAFT_246520 [Hypomontagnella monticulosa]